MRGVRPGDKTSPAGFKTSKGGAQPAATAAAQTTPPEKARRPPTPLALRGKGLGEPVYHSRQTGRATALDRSDVIIVLEKK